MDHKIKAHTIARTPVSIRRFPKLCLRKNLKHSQDIQNDVVPESSNKSKSLSPEFKCNIIETPPFVTMCRPTIRTISKSNVSTTDVVIPPEPCDEIKSDEGLNKSVDDKILKTPLSNESSKIDITPDTANLMDTFYGDMWRSTPGLFKKKMKLKNIDDDLIEGLNTLNIKEDNLESKIDSVEKKSCDLDESDILIVKRKNTLKCLSSSSSDSEDSDTINPNIPILNTSLLSSINDKLNIIKTDEITEEIGSIVIDDDVKPSKVIIDTSDTKSNKENINKDVKKSKNIKSQLPVKASDKNTKSNKTEDRKAYGFVASLGDNIPPEYRDRKAKYYRENFKSKKKELANILFKMYNANVFRSEIPETLPIIWSSTLTTTAGRAHNKLVHIKENGQKTTGRRSEIQLSIKVLDTAHRLRDTLAHELCHVAVWLIDGIQQGGHGPYWKSWVNKVLRRYPQIGSLPVCHSLEIHFKYTYKCTKCGYKINRHSKSIDISKSACGYCHGKFECILNKKNKEGVVVSTPTRQRKEATGFALYVKDNYGLVRGNNTPHKETMKYLGRQYAKMKMGSKENNMNIESETE